MARRLDEVRTSSAMIFVSLDLRVLQAPMVSGDAVKLYGLLADSINTQTHVGYVSRERIAVYLGKSARSVDRVLSELMRHGIVTARRRYNQTSLYTVHHFDTLPAAVAQDAAAARAKCDELHTVTLEVVPDTVEKDTPDLAQATPQITTDTGATDTPDVAEASTLTPDMAEASGHSHAKSVGTVTPNLSTYQDENIKTSRKPSTSAVADARPEVLELCNRLADAIAENDEDHKRPTVTKAWLDACRLLIDRDGRDPAKIAGLIDWCQESEFWRTNVLSMRSFRKQYRTMRAQALAEWEKAKRQPRGSAAERTNERVTASGALRADTSPAELERLRARKAELAAQRSAAS